MATYDTNVIIECNKESNKNNEACEIIFNDDNCIIPPTTYNELKSVPKDIKDHCSIFSYDDHPFDKEWIEINEFTDDVKSNLIMGKTKKGRGARKYNEKLRYFQRNCMTTTEEPTHKENDAKIIKESNVLKEYGYIDDLYSYDNDMKDEICQAILKERMENLGEKWEINIIGLDR